MPGSTSFLVLEQHFLYENQHYYVRPSSLRVRSWLELFFLSTGLLFQEHGLLGKTRMCIKSPLLYHRLRNLSFPTPLLKGTGHRVYCL